MKCKRNEIILPKKTSWQECILCKQYTTESGNLDLLHGMTMWQERGNEEWWEYGLINT